ncbi:MAG: hypothetical protein LC776_03680, partial [Acidobacteria bacterium]|nr:hypothetical protein [Acidobacteriota bacterium]
PATRAHRFRRLKSSLAPTRTGSQLFTELSNRFADDTNALYLSHLRAVLCLNRWEKVVSKLSAAKDERKVSSGNYTRFPFITFNRS